MTELDKPEQSSANNAGTDVASDTPLTHPVRKTFRADLTAERLREVLAS